LPTSSRLTFRPPLWATLLLLAALGLFVGAGVWQLDRKAQKEQLFASFDDGGGADSLDGPVSDAEAAALRYQPIRLRGRYDGARQILLDSMVRDGRAGYQVLTPLRTARGNVLVNRGWIAAPIDRRQLPHPIVAGNVRQVRGRVDRLPRPGLRLPADAPEIDAPWPRRLLFPTAREISSQLGYPVYDYQVLLHPDAPDGFLRDWRPGVSRPDMHFGYAIQWFAFAVAVTVIYLALNVKRQH
jgi:surfeit locus 1 family protein